LVINAAILIMAGEIVDGFKLDGFWPALLLSLVISTTHVLLGGNTRVQRINNVD
jgi:putative membrane protein